MKRGMVLTAFFSSVISTLVTAVLMLAIQPAVVEAQVARLTAAGITVVGVDNLAGVTADVRSTGGGTLNILGSDGKTARIALGCCGSPAGQPPILGNAGISINDVDGKPIGRIGTLDQVSPAVVIGTELRDSQNNVRYRASVGVDGNPTIQLFDIDGNVVWSAP